MSSPSDGGHQGEHADDDERDTVVPDIRALAAHAADELAHAEARDEALARFVPARRALVLTRKPTMVPLGRVWRLGVLLLGRDATLYATGMTTRALEPGRPGYQSQSAELRREYRAAAFRGPFAPGETVNFDARLIDLSPAALASAGGPLVLDGERPLVRWAAAGAAAVPLDVYLADRVALLAHPPQGAS